MLKDIKSKLSEVTPLEIILSFIGIDPDSSEDSESDTLPNELDFEDIKKENNKRNFVIDTLMCQTGDLRLCYEELIFKKLTTEI